MSVYAHGSASHCALGYLVSHQTTHVAVPKRVAGVSGKVIKIECGKTFTVCLTEQGFIYRWGKDFGLVPQKLATDINFSNLHACPFSGEIIAIQKTTNLVFTMHVSGELNKLTSLNGKALHAVSVASSKNAWIVVQAESFSILEIPRNTQQIFVPSLSPSSHILLSPAERVWSAPSGFLVSQHAESGEVLVWRTLLVSPAKIFIRNCDIGGEWESASCEFSLKHIDAIALPLIGGGCIGYALCRDKTCIVSFNLDRSERSIIGETVTFSEPVEWRSIAWDADGLLAVDSHGVLYLIPHDRVKGFSIQLSNCTVILTQVEAIASSGHHVSSLVNILPHNVQSTQTSELSLQNLCTESVMRGSVTVENVSNLLDLLLDRAVIDLPFLLDCTLSFFLRNRGLISIIAPDAIQRVETRHDFKCLQHFHHGADKISSTLLGLRQEDPECIPTTEEPETLHSVFSPKVTTKLRKSPKPLSPACSTASGSVDPSPVISSVSTPVVSVILSEKEIESAFNLDDFAPIADKENFRRASSSSLLDKKVSKWTKHKINMSTPLAPWMHAQIPPAPATQISPISQLLSDQLHERLSQSRARTLTSRWYTGSRSPPESLPEIIRSEKEKNEEIEAIRLVEEYERYQARQQARCETRLDNRRSRKAPTRKYHCKLK